MAAYSEATMRVFERSLEIVKDKLDPERVEELRALVTAGRLGDLDAVEEVLRPKRTPHGDR